MPGLVVRPPAWWLGVAGVYHIPLETGSSLRTDYQCHVCLGTSGVLFYKLKDLSAPNAEENFMVTVDGRLAPCRMTVAQSGWAMESPDYATGSGIFA